MTVEISERAAEELAEYARWVEKWSGIGPNEARYKTVDFALRETFRRDRVWQAERRAPAEPARATPAVATPVGPRPATAASPSVPPPPGARAMPDGGRS